MNVIECGSCKIPIQRCIPHEHKAWEIILNVSGENRSRIGEKVYEISAGDVMVVPPGTLHYGESEGYYTDMFLKAEELDFSDTLVIHDLDGSIQVLMKMISRVMLQKEFNFETIADQLLEALCQYAKKAVHVNTKYPFVHQLKNRIYEHISDIEFDLTDEIQKLGFHPDYLRRCFKEELGKTPLEYLTWLRIRRGKLLMLQDTYVGVEDVAEQCGFRDSFYFSTCFKKHVGLSPLQYRKKREISQKNS